MEVKRAIISGLITLLTVAFLVGCTQPVVDSAEPITDSAQTLELVPEQPPPADKLTAKEALTIIDSAKETLGVDGDLIYIRAGNSHDELAITEGAAPIWSAGFYSESEETVQEVHYFAWYTSSGKGVPELMSNPRSGIQLTAYDLTDWNIDSPEACDIAAQNGSEGIEWVRLQTANLEPLNTSLLYITPDFIPESTKIFWVIRDDNRDLHYINANTGEYLGCVII